VPEFSLEPTLILPDSPLYSLPLQPDLYSVRDTMACLGKPLYGDNTQLFERAIIRAQGPRHHVTDAAQVFDVSLVAHRWVEQSVSGTAVVMPRAELIQRLLAAGVPFEVK